ncbi:transmembrane protein 271-like [Pygocentrus nattereri]|uniref:transmembrane protein 271-like n=1 Tax=Pygocentrus nattereri TaxID=42514 RepID=UPI001891105F|nr:transmembrane protein 271-like [Pygocentrus nattereri]
MKWSGRGVCAVAVSGTLLFTCAASAAVVGFKCVALGARVRARFHLGRAAGAFYSGILLALGQALLCAALVCCRRRGVSCGNFFLVGLLVFVLGVLTAFSGAVVDGDAVALVERKYARYCSDASASRGASAAEAEVREACDALRDYQRALLASAVLNALECLLGLLNLLLVKRCQNARFYRRQRRRERARGPLTGGGGGAVGTLVVLSGDERDLAAAPSPAFRAYVNTALCRGGPDEGGAEVQRSGHPSSELPGYSPSDPELNHSYPFSYPLPNESPPAYEDIFPGEAREQRARAES